MSRVLEPGQAPRRPAPSLVSLVVPVYNERENLRPLASAVEGALAGQHYELLFVDDGSNDGTFEEISALAVIVSKLWPSVCYCRRA